MKSSVIFLVVGGILCFCVLAYFYKESREEDEDGVIRFNPHKLGRLLQHTCSSFIPSFILIWACNVLICCGSVGQSCFDQFLAEQEIKKSKQKSRLKKPRKPRSSAGSPHFEYLPESEEDSNDDIEGQVPVRKAKRDSFAVERENIDDNENDNDNQEKTIILNGKVSQSQSRNLPQPTSKYSSDMKFFPINQNTEERKRNSQQVTEKTKQPAPLHSPAQVVKPSADRPMTPSRLMLPTINSALTRIRSDSRIDLSESGKVKNSLSVKDLEELIASEDVILNSQPRKKY